MSGSMYGGGQNSLTALYLSNPQLANALRQQMLAAPFSQEGTSSEPIRSPWQGVNRLAQAGIAALLMNRAENSATDSQKQQQDMMAAALKNDSAFPMPVRDTVTPQVAPQPAGGGSIYPGVAPAPAGIHQVEASGSMQPGIRGDGGAAAGPMQVHPAALADVNARYGTSYTHPELASNPEVGKRVGDAYYSTLLEKYSGDHDKAIVAYNAGAKRVDDAVQQFGADWQKGISPQAAAYLGKVKAAGMPQASPDGGGQVGGVNIPGRPQPQAAGMQQPDYISMAQYKMEQSRKNAVVAAQTGNPALKELAEKQMEEAKMYASMAGNPNSAKSSVRAQQDNTQAQAGATNVTTNVMGNVAEHNAKVGTDQWTAARQAVQANAQTEQQLQVVDTLANGTGGFKTGIAPEMRGQFQQALATLGLPNTASQYDVLNRAQAVLKVGASKLIQGQGNVTENERALVGKTVEIMGSQPEAVPLITEAVRASNEYDRQVFDAYQKSAEKNNGVVNLAEVYREISKIPPPISAKLRNQMEALVGRSSDDKAPAAAAPAQPQYKENDTATGSNGQKLIYRGGKWYPMQ